MEGGERFTKLEIAEEGVSRESMGLGGERRLSENVAPAAVRQGGPIWGGGSSVAGFPEFLKGNQREFACFGETGASLEAADTGRPAASRTVTSSGPYGNR